MRHFVEHLAEFAPMVQILVALVPQMVGQDDVTDALRRMDLSIVQVHHRCHPLTFLSS